MVGEPGMGKTTLLDWLARSAPNLVVLRASGRESEADLPFTAIADLLLSQRDGLSELPPPQARALASALALEPRAGGDPLAVNAAVLNLFASRPETASLLLLIDDYHWLDSASRDVVDFLSRRTRPVGIGVVISTRGAEPLDHDGQRLVLSGLSSDAAQSLVGRNHTVHATVAPRIVELAAGNPLALVEIPLGLTASQLDGTTPLNHVVSVTEALEKAFRSRLQPLSIHSRRALLCAATEGAGSSKTLQEALARLNIPRRGLDEAKAAGLLTIDPPDVSFRHPFLRSVVQQSASREELRDMHLTLAQVVTDDDQRAWHLAAASDGPDEVVSEALTESARRALARGAAANAAVAFEKAADLSTGMTEKIDRIGSAARAAHRAGNMGLTSRLLGRVRSLGQPLDPSLLLLDADLRMRSGDYAGAYGTLRLEAERIAQLDPHRAMTMRLLAAKLRVYRFEAVAALKEVEQALATIPEKERDVVHLASLAMTRTMVGQPEALATTLDAMKVAMSVPHGHINTLGIGWPLVWLEEYETARAFLTRSVEIQREGGYLAYLPQALLPLAELDFRTGRWDQARALGAEALRLFVESQQPTEAAVASGFLARLEAASGDSAASREYASRALRSDVDSGLRVATAYAEAALGTLEIGAGKEDVAVGHLTDAHRLALAGGIGEPMLLLVEADLAEALARSGDRNRSGAVTNALLTRARELGRQSAIAAGLRCSGILARNDAYRDFFEQALSIHKLLPTPFEEARSRLCFGERLRRARKRGEARNHLRNAMEVFDALGSRPWADRARNELAATGDAVSSPRPFLSLTPQERQVAVLVAAGATNREAAACVRVPSLSVPSNGLPKRLFRPRLRRRSWPKSDQGRRSHGQHSPAPEPAG
jgi:tetratricopeptide (TPR) repeat protein